MKRTAFGLPAGWLLALIGFVGLFVYFHKWKSEVGPVRIDLMPQVTKDWILFVRRDETGTNIWMAKADGSEEKQLTNDKSSKRSPVFAPNGKLIVFAGEQTLEGTTTTYQLFALGGDKPRPITTTSGAKDYPEFAPDGRTLAYLVGGNIKQMKPNGEQLEQIYPHPHKGGSGEKEDGGAEAAGAMMTPPVQIFKFSPSGVQLAMVQTLEGEQAPVYGNGNWFKDRKRNAAPAADTGPESEALSIYELESEKPNARGTANRIGFDWIDQKRLLATMTGMQGRHLIFVIRADEKDLTPTIPFAAEGFTIAVENPSVSPDGKRVAVEVWRIKSSDDRELMGISVLNIEQDPPILVRTEADIAKVPLIIKGQARSPKFSPDGTRILYSMGKDLYVCTAEGGNPINITKGRGENDSASWSPAK
jgi:Tol biopolymer transport system component